MKIAHLRGRYVGPLDSLKGKTADIRLLGDGQVLARFPYDGIGWHRSLEKHFNIDYPEKKPNYGAWAFHGVTWLITAILFVIVMKSLLSGVTP